MESPDTLEPSIRARMEERHIPGLTLAIVRKGAIVHSEAFGRAHLEWDIPATVETVYEIGSVTKQMTATLVMMQVETGRVGLDDPVICHLPAVPEGWRGITIRHLLTHTGGLPNYTDLPGFWMREHLSREGFIERLAQYPPVFEPGTRFEYNNSGYNLLGFMLEELTGQGFWDVLRGKILEPLGMADTRPRNHDTVIPRRAAGYVFEHGELRNRDPDICDVQAAGFLVSTLSDLAKWDAAIGTSRFVSPQAQEQMWTPHVLPSGEATRYGFGWGIGETNGQKFVSHGGSTSGYSAAMRRFTDLGLTLIVLTNTETEDAALDVLKTILPLVEPLFSA